jgi:hypothetical protein
MSVCRLAALQGKNLGDMAKDAVDSGENAALCAGQL